MNVLSVSTACVSEILLLNVHKWCYVSVNLKFKIAVSCLRFVYPFHSHNFSDCGKLSLPINC